MSHQFPTFNDKNLDTIFSWAENGMPGASCLGRTRDQDRSAHLFNRSPTVQLSNTTCTTVVLVNERATYYSMSPLVLVLVLALVAATPASAVGPPYNSTACTQPLSCISVPNCLPTSPQLVATVHLPWRPVPCCL